jgi:hypothetical protein
MLLRAGEPLLTRYVTAAELDAAITAAADKGDLGVVSDVLAMLDSNSMAGLVSKQPVKQIMGNALQAACQGHQKCQGVLSCKNSGKKHGVSSSHQQCQHPTIVQLLLQQGADLITMQASWWRGQCSTNMATSCSSCWMRVQARWSRQGGPMQQAAPAQAGGKVTRSYHYSSSW